MKINGNQVEIGSSTTLEDVLVNQGFSPATVVVELNGQVITKAQFTSTNVHQDDVAEVLNFVGGG
jgi:sulfur carrier protein